MKATENLESDSSWISYSKFTPSKPNIDLVDRVRLLDLLEQARRGKAVFLMAPAGFGKSTILSQWYEASRDRIDIFGWLSLDETDSDPLQFLSYVALALAEAGADFGQFEVAARNGFPDSNPRMVLDSILRRVANLNRECVLILDDAHRASSPENDRLIEHIVRHAPANFTLVVNSRASPPIDIPMLVASGDVAEIGPEQLRLTRQEAISALGTPISSEDAEEIFELTEGWPVAIQLARVQKQAKPAEPLQRDVSSGLIASYLTHQVLDTLEPELREFLLDISVLEQFNIPLADAVTGSKNSVAMLRQLEPFRALIIPTGPGGSWMRLHHLFAEYLRDTLRMEDPSREAQLYRSASAWFEQEGSLIPSVQYATLAGDDDLVERLILDAGGWSIILTEGISVMRTLLRMAPEHLVSSSARLLMAKAYLNCKDGNYHAARGLYDASMALRATGEAEMYDRDSRLVSAMVCAYEDDRDWTVRTIDLDLPKQLDDWSPLEAGTLLCESVMALISAGRLEKANRNLEIAFGEMRRSGSVLGLNYCYIHAAALALYAGRIDLAKANIEQSLELAENNFGSDSGLQRLSLVIQFAIRAWTGEAERDEIEDFSRALAHVEQNDGWCEVYLVGLDGIISLCEQYGEYAKAAELCDRLMQLAKFRNLARLERECIMIKMRVAQLRGHSNEARALAENVTDWLKSHDLKTATRDWQNHYLGVSLLAGDRLTSSAVAHASLRACLKDAEERGAHFHAIRLMIAEAVLSRQLDNREKCIESMTNALAGAAPQRIMGPFLSPERLEPILADIKSDLSLRQERLTLVNFVSEILKRRRQLRPHADDELLSPREQEIIRQLAQGRSNKEIARRFELTENTVKFHLKNIYSKLSVNRRTQAIAAARRREIID